MTFLPERSILFAELVANNRKMCIRDRTEAPGFYKYYSTQRPVDIGTFPKPPHNAPAEIVNYDRRSPVEGEMCIRDR